IALLTPTLIPYTTLFRSAFLGEDTLGALLARLDHRDAAGSLTRMSATQAADILESIDPDDATDILQVINRDDPESVENILVAMQDRKNTRLNSNQDSISY